MTREDLLHATLLGLTMFGTAVACTSGGPAREGQALDPLRAFDVESPDIDLDELPSGIRRDHVRRDVELLTEFAHIFPPAPASAPSKRIDASFVGEHARCSSIEQGLGITSHACRMWGEYLSCRLDTLRVDGRVIESNATCRVAEDVWAVLAPVLGPALDATVGAKGFSRDGRLADLHFLDASTKTQARERTSRRLGTRPSGNRPSPELGEAFARLTSPWVELTVGTACGIAAAPPEGNPEMYALVEAGRADLLRDVLGGMNAAGRIYGYIGLRMLEANTPADDATFATIEGLDVGIRTCSGCKGTYTRASEVSLVGFQRAPETGRAHSRTATKR